MNISVTPEAAQHLRDESHGRVLRIAFTTGCGGSGYRLSYADEPLEGDRIVDVDGLRLVLDDMSASRLNGAVIEYEDDGFVLDHPDAVSVAWCG